MLAGSWLERGDASWVLWTIAALLFSMLFIGHHTRKRKITYYYEHPLPPRSTIGVWEQLQQFGSVEFHLQSLESTRNQGKILQYNLWPISRDPIFAVNDPKIARKIQENPKSLKPRILYDVFDGLVGGACFISEEGDRYKHPRKSTLVGISHANMDSMLTNMHLVMDQWITQNLGKEVGDVVNVDIGAESKLYFIIRIL
jgi:cytochrome P450